MKSLDETDQYARMGMAATIPGLVRAIEIMQAELDRLRASLNGVAPKKRGRPSARKPVRTDTPSTRSYGWPSDPEERKREMARRRKVATVNLLRTEKGKPVVKLASPKLHPRDPRHPKHDEYIKKIRAVQIKAWNNLTPQQRKTRLANMNAGRKRAAA